MTTIEQLEAEKAALLRRVTEIESLISEFRAWERRVSAVVSGNVSATISDVTAGTADPTRTEITRKQGHNQGTPMAEFTSAVLSILSQSDKPMNRSALLDVLIARGIDVGGSDPRNTLSARMSRMDRFVNIAGYGYWPRERDFPQAMHFAPRALPQ